MLSIMWLQLSAIRIMSFIASGFIWPVIPVIPPCCPIPVVGGAVGDVVSWAKTAVESAMPPRAAAKNPVRLSFMAYL